MVAFASVTLKPHVNAMIGMIAAHVAAASGERNYQVVSLEVKEMRIAIFLKHRGVVILDETAYLGEDDIIKTLEKMDRSVLKMLKLREKFSKEVLDKQADYKKTNNFQRENAQ